MTAGLCLILRGIRCSACPAVFDVTVFRLEGKAASTLCPRCGSESKQLPMPELELFSVSAWCCPEQFAAKKPDHRRRRRKEHAAF
jgi:hypothetical protein